LVYIRRIILLATLVASLGMWAGYAFEYTSVAVGRKVVIFLVWWERSELKMSDEIALAIAEDRLDDAATLIQMNSDYSFPHSNSWDKEIARKSTFFYAAKTVPVQAAKGVFLGDMDSPTSLAATIASDLFVVGDIRDLGVQAYRVSRGEELDRLVAALATIGVVSSAVIYATGGAATPAAAGVSIAKIIAKKSAKNSAKAGKEVKRFRGFLESKTREVVDFDLISVELKGIELSPAGVQAFSTKFRSNIHFDKASQFFSDVGTIKANSGGIRNSIELLGRVADDDSLKAVKRATKAFGEKTVLMVRLGGPKVVKVFSRLFQKLVWLVGALITTAIVAVQCIWISISIIRKYSSGGSRSF
jgi:hypothetical protein